ncbi:MAG TPA: DUF3047 domain-containing protein [Syntrophales bacterium]|nr:DUF3047 domain-containing protein [Syntrophales bacterium]
MKKTLIIIVSVSLFLAFIPLSACQKVEPKKPEVSAVSPVQCPPATALLPAQPSVPAPPEAVPPTEVPSVQPPARGEPTSAPEVPTPATVAAMKPKAADTIRVAVFDSAQMQNGAPTGWLLETKKGEPVLSLEKGSRLYYLHMKSRDSSFGVKRGITVDIKEYPYLNWRWKVTRLPDGGDVRKSNTDDQAAQLYVAFTPTGFPEALSTPVLGYIWDNEAPKGWTGRSSAIGGGKLRYVVVRDKTDGVGQWHTEKRNIYEDYRNLLKDIQCAEPAGLTHGVEFYINTQNTKAWAESYIGNVYFSKR